MKHGMMVVIYWVFFLFKEDFDGDSFEGEGFPKLVFKVAFVVAGYVFGFLVGKDEVYGVVCGDLCAVFEFGVFSSYCWWGFLLAYGLYGFV